MYLNTKKIEYCLIPFIIGAIVEIILHISGITWSVIPIGIPEALTVIFCLILKMRYKHIWATADTRLLCIGSLLLGYSIAFLINSGYFFPLYPMNVRPVPGPFTQIWLCFLGCFFSRMLFFAFLFIWPSFVIAIFITKGMKPKKRLLAIIILSILMFWPGFFIVPM